MWRLSNARANRLLNRTAYGILNPRIYHNKYQLKQDKRIRFYPIVGMRGTRSATILMNKPNYNNMLSTECLEEMYRFFRSFELDESVNHIWVENRGTNCFGGGVELDEVVRDDDYLRKLFQLTCAFAKMNKPVFGHVKGSVRGASAYLLRMLSRPFGATNANLQLDDIDHGWVPTCGGSYQLSRLTGDIGTYLALTGESIDADEMCELGFLYALLRQGKKDWYYLRIASKESSLAGHDHYVDEFDTEDTTFEELKFTNGVEEDFSRLMKEERMHILRTQSKEQLALSLTKSLKKQQHAELMNIRSPYNAGSVRQHIINYFRYKESLVDSAFNDQDLLLPHKAQVFRRLPLSKINKHFHYNSIEEIIQSLEKDDSKWAQYTAKTLKTKDPLALKLTLRLIREATNSDFTGCIEREYRVAARLRESDHFKYFYKTRYVAATLSYITSDQVNSYFFETGEHELQHNLKKFALYPVKDYKDVLPDSVRFFLNRDYLEDLNQPANQYLYVKRWLKAQRISIEGVTFDPDVIREKVWLKLALERKVKAEVEAIADMLFDQNVEKEYRYKRGEFVEKVFSDEAAAKKLISDQIALLFRRRVKERGDELNDTAKCYGKEQKSDLFLEIRNILTEKRLTESEKVQKEYQPSFQGLVYFPKDIRQGIMETFDHHYTDTPFEIIKRKIDEGTLNEPFTSLEYAEMLTPLNSDRDPQYTLENPKYREYKLRYNEEYPKIFNNMFGQLIEIAQQCSTNMNYVLEKLSAEQLQQSLMQETYVGNNYGDLIKKFMVELQREPELTALLPSEETDWHTALKPIDVGFEDGMPVFILKDNPIPDNLKSKFGPLLQRIYRGVCQRYGKWDHLTSKLSTENGLDRDLMSAVAQDWNEFVRNDVTFLFSYFAIREVEKLLYYLLKEYVLRDETRLLTYLRKIGLNFSSHEEVAESFSNFMYRLIETYDRSKYRLLFASSKHIERMNRTQTDILTEKSEPSLRAFLLTLAKERSVLLDRLNGASHLFKGNTPANVDNLKDFTSDDQLSVYLQMAVRKNSKRLIEGSTYYLRELSRVYQLLMGVDNFLPQNLAIDKTLADIPYFFSELDQRKPVELWFEEKLQEVLRAIFDFRLYNEQKLSKQELIAFDRYFSELLKPANFKELMLEAIRTEMKLLEEIRAATFQHQSNSSKKPKYKSFMSFVKNRDALHRLNNLLMTVKLENANGKDHSLYDYEETVDRLLTETLAEKKDKKLDEKYLQSYNFRWIASQRIEFDKRDSELKQAKEALKTGETTAEQTTLAAELRSICKLHSHDRLFQELARQL